MKPSSWAGGQGAIMTAAPKFRADVAVSEIRERDGKAFVILKDPISQNYFRISNYEYHFLRALDGFLSLEAVIEKLKMMGRYYPEDRAKAILDRAARAGLLLGTRYGTGQFQANLKQTGDKAKELQRVSSMFFLFVPVLNPDKFLEMTLPVFRLLVNRFTATVLLFLLPGAFYLLIDGIPNMQTEYLFFFNMENLLYLWITIALCKLIHEFAHAYTAKYFGMHVPEMGVAFLLFFPCLYCDTSDAWQLGDRRQRIWISAAGILAEAVIAVVSVYVWYFTRPGIVNSVAFYLLAYSMISTVLFNGNPLARFDGYFVLMDLLGKPNLVQNSVNHLKYLYMNRFLGITRYPKIARTLNDNIIYSIYGVGQFLYRITLYGGIIMGVYHRFDKTLGIQMAIVAIFLFVVRPIVNGLRSVWRLRDQIQLRLRESLTFAGIVSACVLPLFIPWQSTSVYPCYLDSQRTQKLTVPLQTAIKEVYAATGHTMKKGSVLFDLDTSQLEVTLHKKQIEKDIATRELELARLDEEYKGTAAGKMVELRKAVEALHNTDKELQIAVSGVTAPFDGTVTVLDKKVQDGYAPGQGQIVGEFKSATDCVAQALVPGDEIHRIRLGQSVAMWFPVGTGLTIPGKIESVKEYGQRDLATTPFSVNDKGELATGGEGRKPEKDPSASYYVCSVGLPENNSVPLGLSGNIVVPSQPKSTVRRVYESVWETIHKESLF
ncbi:MAG: site-2 protease family protein [Pseudomonadota bacterium]